MKPKAKQYEESKIFITSHKKVETQVDESLNIIAKQSFGPSLKFQNKPNINRGVKKIIHYDCRPEKPSNCESLNHSQDEVPNENEIYEKKTLLKKDHSQDQGDDISLVNINVSVLFSSENNSGVNNTHLTNLTNVTSLTNKSHQSQYTNEKSSVLEYSADSKSKPSLSGKSLNTPQNNSISNNSAENNQERAFVRERVKNILKNKTKYIQLKEINNSQNNHNTSNTNTLDPEELEELYDTVDINQLSSNITNKDFKESHSSASKGFKSINRSKKTGTHQIFSFNKSCSVLPNNNLKDNSQLNINKDIPISNYSGYGRFNSISHNNEAKSRAEPLLKNLNSLKLITNKTITSKPHLKETKITKEEISISSLDKEKDEKEQSATSSSSPSVIESILKNYPGSIELLNKDNKVINIINISNTYTIENVTINNYVDNKSKINLKNYVKSSSNSKLSSQTPAFGMKSEIKKNIPQIINKYNNTASKFSSTTNAKSKKIDFINLSSQVKK